MVPGVFLTKQAFGTEELLVGWLKDRKGGEGFYIERMRGIMKCLEFLCGREKSWKRLRRPEWEGILSGGHGRSRR